MSDPLGGLLSGSTETERRPLWRPVPPPQRGRKPVVLLKLLVAIVVLAGLAAGVIFGARSIISDLTKDKKAADYAGSGTGSVEVVIKPGQTATQIGATLVSLGVVKSQSAFTAAAKADPTRAAKIQPGSYLLHKQMSGRSAFLLLFDPSAKNATPYTIPEGYALSQSLPIIAKATGLKLEDLVAASKNVAALGLPSWADGVTSAEGFLFPATYAPKRNTSAVDVLRPMVAKFNQEATKLGLVAKASNVGLSPLQVVTLASIVEKEVNTKSDFGQVARVIYNRLAQPGNFPTLGMDSTTRYAVGKLSGTLTPDDLSNPSPYNTRVSSGIPPGPIGSPGDATLTAVLNPPAGDETYFIFLPSQNKTIFTNNSYDFNNLVAQCHQESPNVC
jgi:UPF0755 protein